MTGKTAPILRRSMQSDKRPMQSALFALHCSVTQTRPAGLQTESAMESGKCGGLYAHLCWAPPLRRLARSVPKQPGGAMAQLELLCVAAWASCPRLEIEMPAAVLHWHWMFCHWQRRSQAPHAVTGDRAMTVCACPAKTRRPGCHYGESQLQQQRAAVEPLLTQQHPPEQHP